MDKSTIVIRDITRKRMKKTARKDQTYDDLINELIDRKKHEDPPDGRLKSLPSSEFMST
jgi:predicted CopG family antitoxin